MPPCPRNPLDAHARGIQRWTWRILVVVQCLNALDWGTTVLGVGVFGMPEQGQATAYLIRELGVLGGTTAMKLAAAVIFAGLAAAGATIAAQPHREGTVVSAGMLVVLVYAAVLLAQTVLSNTVVVCWSVHRCGTFLGGVWKAMMVWPLFR